MAHQYVRRPTPEDKIQAKREYLATYHRTHKDKVKAASRRYYLAHKDEIKRKNAAYRDANRDRINAAHRARYRSKRLEEIEQKLENLRQLIEINFKQKPQNGKEKTTKT